MSQLEFLISPLQYHQSKRCGYCNLQDKQDSPSLLKSCLICTHIYHTSARIYEALINKGYRRSGSFLYAYDDLRNCCQLFTIRTRFDPDTTKSTFNISKEMKRRINKFSNAIGSDLKNPKNKFDFLNSIRNLQRNGTGKFRTNFEPANFSKQKYELYKIYQMKVHNDEESDVTQKSFKNFLCTNVYTDKYDSNLLKSLNNWFDYESKEILEIARGILGAFHECYYLDEELIAISVIDILPHCISSVYFIWHPDYSHLGLGTISALRDIAMTHHIGKEHYYLGYISLDCPKMSYKQKFGGELLDRTNNKFVNLELLHSGGALHDGGPIILKDFDKGLNDNQMRKSIYQYVDAPGRVCNVQQDIKYTPTWKIDKGKILLNIAKNIYSTDKMKDGKSIYAPLPTFFVKLNNDSQANYNSNVDGFPDIVIGFISKKQLEEEIIGSDFDICNDIGLLEFKSFSLSVVSFKTHDDDYKTAEAAARFLGPDISRHTSIFRN